MKVVVDTNVTVVANGRNTHASLGCQYACISFLEGIASTKSRTKIVLDANGLILDEYKGHLSYSGQPGVGDVFFKFLHDQMHQSKKVQLVTISPISDETRGFNELPINPVDMSDRKFLAVAVVSGAEITNAVDTDWHDQRVFVANLHVIVRQLCPEHGCS